MKGRRDCGTHFALFPRVPSPTSFSFFVGLALVASCQRAPSRTEAVAVVTRARPMLAGTPVTRRVWLDGPPWFSCAEVLAKLRSRTDSAAVRGQVGNWRQLVVAGWVVLRDTSAGEVAEPGWCTARLLDDSARVAGGWRIVHGDSLPSGSLRRGWDVPVGTRRISVASAPHVVGHDSAATDVLVGVEPNANGRALAASRDTVHFRALLVRGALGWELGSLTPEPR